MLKFVKFVLILIFLFKVNGGNRKNRIVGGKETNINKHPHQVSLRNKKIDSEYFIHYCGGTIYSHRLIISASHCVYQKKASQIIVVAGTNYRTITSGFIAKVEKIVAHENFDYDNLKYDIALLYLGTPLLFDNFSIKPIQLADERPPIGAIATISGWGKTSEDAYDYPEQLREVRIPIISNIECKKMYPEIEIIDMVLCAGISKGGKDGCQGDSGGPFVYEGKLVGVTSYGKGCAQAHSPGVFTSIPDMRGWIEKHAKDFSEKNCESKKI